MFIIKNKINIFSNQIDAILVKKQPRFLKNNIQFTKKKVNNTACNALMIIYKLNSETSHDSLLCPHSRE